MRLMFLVIFELTQRDENLVNCARHDFLERLDFACTGRRINCKYILILLYDYNLGQSVIILFHAMFNVYITNLICLLYL